MEPTSETVIAEKSEQKRKPGRPRKPKTEVTEDFGQADVLTSTPAFTREPKSLDQRGICLLAIGHPYYAHMAFNLAVAIKHHMDIPIAILQKDDSLAMLPENTKGIFKHKIEVPDQATYGKHGYDPYMVKLSLPELSPFEETLFLDVDMTLSPTKDLSDWVEELAIHDFAIANRGRIKIGEQGIRSNWCDLEEIKSAYGVDELYDLQSEVIWFKKCDRVTRLFERARKVYSENKFSVKPFGKGKPDEVYLMVAMELEKVKVFQSPYMPTYWQPYYFNKTHSRDFMQSFYAISVGGKFSEPGVKKTYDSINRHYFNRSEFIKQHGVTKPPYELLNKSSIKDLQRTRI